MSDSDFLLELAHDAGASTQYTGLPNMREVEYLKAYMADHNFEVPLWGENAGDKGDPLELDQEVLLNGLYGQEYIGANIFEADRVTPTTQYFALKTAHSWLRAAWDGRVRSPVVLNSLPIVQGACIYANATRSVSVCMQDDGNLVLRKERQALWASNTRHGEPGFCAGTGDPALSCSAVFQGDGNFVVRRGSQVLWNSDTSGRGTRILLADEPPYLEISNQAGGIVWSATH
jgi:hypothetical protein